MRKVKVLESSSLFLREQTPLPFPEAGLRETNDEEEEDENGEGEEKEGE